MPLQIEYGPAIFHGCQSGNRRIKCRLSASTPSSQSTIAVSPRLRPAALPRLMMSATPAWRAAGSARSSASGATSSVRAPASASSCSISRSVNSGLTVTTTAPARQTACAANAKAGELGPHTATTSPGRSPRPSSPPASTSTLLVNSPKVSVSPVTPSISAALSGSRRPRASTNELKSRFGRLRSASGLRTIIAVRFTLSINRAIANDGSATEKVRRRAPTSGPSRTSAASRPTCRRRTSWWSLCKGASRFSQNIKRS